MEELVQRSAILLPDETRGDLYLDGQLFALPVVTSCDAQLPFQDLLEC